MKHNNPQQTNNWRCAHVAWLLLQLTSAAENSRLPQQTLRQAELSRLRYRDGKLQLILSEHPLAKLARLRHPRADKNRESTLPTRAFAKRLYKQQLPALLKQPGSYQLLQEAVSDAETFQRQAARGGSAGLATRQRRYTTTTVLTAEINARITPQKPEWIEKLPCLRSRLLC